jgi:diguanylate cyclase (GGDEF)-like protein
MVRETTSTNGTILVIDDNVTNLKVASAHLQAANYEVLTARDGLSGIERIKFAQPDLILLDVQMPGIDGFETCRRLKTDPATAAIPVIFTTVLTNVEDKVRGFTSGAVDYIPKPFQVEELLARVNTHLTIYRLQRELQAEIRERRTAEVGLKKANSELQRLAVLDDLTQLANRRRFDQYLQQQWQPVQPTKLSLLLCDVDYFKRYNDGYGHSAGDVCLQQVARAIGRAVNYTKDLAARYGGEEFAVILPETDQAGAALVAEAVLTEVRNLRIPHAYSEVANIVTLSIGLATITPLSSSDPLSLINTADAALYGAKQQGRNRVVTSNQAVGEH